MFKNFVIGLALFLIAGMAHADWQRMSIDNRAVDYELAYVQPTDTTGFVVGCEEERDLFVGVLTGRPHGGEVHVQWVVEGHTGQRESFNWLFMRDLGFVATTEEVNRNQVMDMLYAMTQGGTLHYVVDFMFDGVIHVDEDGQEKLREVAGVCGHDF